MLGQKARRGALRIRATAGKKKAVPSAGGLFIYGFDNRGRIFWGIKYFTSHISLTGGMIKHSITSQQLKHMESRMQSKTSWSLYQIFSRFSDNEAAKQHMERMRWGNEPFCPHCRCAGNVDQVKNAKPMPVALPSVPQAFQHQDQHDIRPEATYPITNAGRRSIFSPRVRKEFPRTGLPNSWDPSKRRRGIWRIGFENAWSKGTKCWMARRKRTN